MNRMLPILPLVAGLALAACDTPAPVPGPTAVNPQQLHTLVDETGAVVGMVPLSAVLNTPPGTALFANINGANRLVTLGPRMNMGVSGGEAVVTGNSDGRLVVERVTPATGDLAPRGIPVVTSTEPGTGRPIITYVQPGQQAPAGVIAGPRGNRRQAPTAPGQLAPGTAAVVEPAR
ncbi:hypothetical protein EOD42_20785 [Rhodovarius crocodyli]|uniref:Lipoprotein n=1 Tax=Rhodovarius crocodyli TaxID=1979269 RepID=A0A437M242_9PROT|nr:hypothetical protein [Rhodovarius crocodyli]RVT91758.1 hypothetical protein EOD42_20785 [Rhodovarius crocodyli]